MPRTLVGLSTDSFPFSHRTATAYDFLAFCHGLGAAGAESALGPLEPDYIRKVRGRVEELGMFYEAWIDLPKDDASAFERAVIASKEAGATCLRAFCLGGRRYEAFNNFEEWKRFLAESRKRLALAVPVLEKHRLTLGLENHKDWTADEELRLIQEFSSERLGVCLDLGNNISLLDDTRELVEKLAPYTVSTHLKDMAVAECAAGFLLVEVPFGDGIVDLPWAVETIRKARPRTRFTLEMFTRSPLVIPCLTDKFWATFPDRGGARLAGTLRMVREKRSMKPLPNVEAMSQAERLRLEMDNVRQCLAYSRDRLGLAG